MSSKVVLAEKNGYALYQEAFDGTEIHLEIENPNYKQLINHYHGESEEKPIITIPLSVWEDLRRCQVEDW